jgi:hypothetical protein
MTDVHEGGCLCGEVRYRVRGLPNEAIACHCTFCQRRTGGAVGIEVFFSEENIEFTGASHSTYEHRSDETGRWLRLEFCPRCGTTVGMTGEKRPGQRALMGGTFDDPNWFTIGRHIWTRSKVQWLAIPAGVANS